MDWFFAKLLTCYVSQYMPIFFLLLKSGAERRMYNANYQKVNMHLLFYNEELIVY
jgi:hypothetical protein